MRLRLLTLLLFLTIAQAKAQYNVGALLVNAKAEIGKNNFIGAAEKLELLISVKPGNGEAYFFLGICKYYLSDFLGAKNAYDNALKYSPAAYDIYHYRALANDRLGRHEEAMKDFDYCIEKQSGNTKVYVDRAYSKLVAGDYKGSLADCNKAVNGEAFNEELYLCRGAAYSALGDNVSAIKDYNKALELNQRNENTYVRRGMAKSAMKAPKEAIKDFNLALALDSGCTFAYYNRAMAYIDLDNTKAGLKDYATVLKYDPRNTLTYYNRAVLKAKVNDEKGARNDLEKLLQISPNNILAVFMLGKLKHNAGDLKGALEAYTKTIQLWPYFVEAFYNRSLVKKSMNDLLGAQKDYLLGQSISEMNHRKSPEEQQKDSLTLVTLSRFETDFNNADPRAVGKTKEIELMPFFWVAPKDSSLKGDFYSSPVVLELNSQGRIPLYLCSYSPIATNDPKIDSTALASLTVRGSAQKKSDQLRNAIIRTVFQKYSDADTLYNSLIASDSSSAFLYFLRAVNTCLKTEALELAEFELHNVATMPKNFTENEKKKLYKKAIEDLNKAQKLDPKFALSYYNRGVIKCKMHDFYGAAKDFELAAKADDKFSQAYYNKALVLLYLKINEDACISLSKAAELGTKEAYQIIKKYCYKN